MSDHRAFIAAARKRYSELVAEQGEERCAICGNTPKTRNLHIDHDHKLMMLRGLLCHRCNRALPSWATPEWLRAAADYLESPPLAWKRERLAA